MSLKAIVNSLDSVDEALRGHYKESNGKFVLDVVPVGGFALDEVEGLRSALSKERETARDALEKLADFGEISPKQAREALLKMKDISKYKSDDKVKEAIEQAVIDLKKAHADEKGGWDKEKETLVGQLKEVLIDRDARAAMEKAGVASSVLLLPHVQSQTRIRQNKDGRFVAEVLDTAGNPRLKDGQGTLFSIAELVGEMKNREEFAPAFRGVNASGGGTPPQGGQGGGSGRTISRTQFDSLSPEEKLSFGKDRNNKVVDSN